jgi:hypothetical protein
VREFIPAESAKILEVGSGSELIAPELSTLGYQMTVVEKGETGFLALDSEDAFDAVLFSHSFHQMTSLESVLNKAKKLLSEKGKILIDDRAAEEMDLKTASWFYHLLELYSLVANTNRELEVAPGDSPLDRWKKEHHHQTPHHSQAEILRVMERNFGKIYSATVPYLYRYFVEDSTNLARADDAVDKVFNWEKSLIQEGLIKPIGFRIASKKYFSYLQ